MSNLKSIHNITFLLIRFEYIIFAGNFIWWIRYPANRWWRMVWENPSGGTSSHRHWNGIKSSAKTLRIAEGFLSRISLWPTLGRPQKYCHNLWRGFWDCRILCVHSGICTAWYMFSIVIFLQLPFVTCNYNCHRRPYVKCTGNRNWRIAHETCCEADSVCPRFYALQVGITAHVAVALWHSHELYLASFSQRHRPSRRETG